MLGVKTRFYRHFARLHQPIASGQVRHGLRIDSKTRLNRCKRVENDLKFKL